MRGKLYGIGVGPGDPELLTIKAKRILDNVHIIAIPKTSSEKKGQALSIVEGMIEEKKELLELYFPMSYDNTVLKDSWMAAAEAVQKKLDSGKDVAFITLGDPTVYSTYIYLHKIIIEKGYEAQIIPGVTSFCASAARAGISLAEGGEPIAIIPSAYDNSQISKVLDLFDNVVLMKASKSIGEINSILNEKGLTGKAVLVNRCSFEDEEIEYDLEKAAHMKYDYFTTIIIKKSGVK